jgi:RNA polymerase sigma-70 factor (ECF subfamily)
MDEEIRAHLDRRRWEDAVELIARQYQTKVFHLAVSMLGNRELAEDALQEALLRIWKALPGYRGDASISTWVFAIARNTCLTALKSAGARKALPLETRGVERAVPMEARHAPDLEGLIAQLPQPQRQVVTLFYMEEKSYEEVARLLDIPMGTVKTHLHRARKELALLWKKETADAVRVV